MKTLIFSQTHIRSEGQGRLFAVNHQLIRRLNPGVDIMVIDNASPLDPISFLPSSRWATARLPDQFDPCAGKLPKLRPGSHVDPPVLVRFAESLGHFFYGHTHGLPVRDGPGRAHSLAWLMMIEGGYDRGAYIEADALFRHPVWWLFDRMRPHPVGCQPGGKYYSADWHVWGASIPWLAEFDFVGKYDWKNRVGEPGGEPAGENVYIGILGDHLTRLPIVGDRGDATALNEHNLEQQYPQGMDLITHVTIPCFAKWLRMNGHEDLARQLELPP